MNDKSNNALAGILLAGIVAMSAGFVAKIVYHPHSSEEVAAYPIEVTEGGDAGAGAQAVVATADPIADLIAGADAAHGEKLFKVCAACHTIDAGGANKVGPNLAGIVGRATASHGGFAYSDAMKAKGGSWTVDELNAFLWNPKKTVAGTKMAYAGMKKAEDRAALVKYLKSK